MDAIDQWSSLDQRDADRRAVAAIIASDDVAGVLAQLSREFDMKLAAKLNGRLHVMMSPSLRDVGIDMEIRRPAGHDRPAVGAVVPRATNDPTEKGRRSLPPPPPPPPTDASGGASSAMQLREALSVVQQMAEDERRAVGHSAKLISKLKAQTQKFARSLLTAKAPESPRAAPVAAAKPMGEQVSATLDTSMVRDAGRPTEEQDMPRLLATQRPLDTRDTSDGLDLSQMVIHRTSAALNHDDEQQDHHGRGPGAVPSATHADASRNLQPLVLPVTPSGPLRSATPSLTHEERLRNYRLLQRDAVVVNPQHLVRPTSTHPGSATLLSSTSLDGSVQPAALFDTVVTHPPFGYNQNAPVLVSVIEAAAADHNHHHHHGATTGKRQAPPPPEVAVSPPLATSASPRTAKTDERVIAAPTAPEGRVPLTALRNSTLLERAAASTLGMSNARLTSSFTPKGLPPPAPPSPSAPRLMNDGAPADANDLQRAAVAAGGGLLRGGTSPQMAMADATHGARSPGNGSFATPDGYVPSSVKPPRPAASGDDATDDATPPPPQTGARVARVDSPSSASSYTGSSDYDYDYDSSSRSSSLSRDGEPPGGRSKSNAKPTSGTAAPLPRPAQAAPPRIQIKSGAAHALAAGPPPQRIVVMPAGTPPPFVSRAPPALVQSGPTAPPGRASILAGMPPPSALPPRPSFVPPAFVRPPAPHVAPLVITRGATVQPAARHDPVLLGAAPSARAVTQGAVVAPKPAALRKPQSAM